MDPAGSEATRHANASRRKELHRRFRRLQRRHFLFLLLLGTNLPAVQTFKNGESNDHLLKVPLMESTTSSQHPSITSPFASNVIGSSSLPAKVYVKLNHNSPHIMCLTQRLRDAELTDPQYKWHGPGRQSLPDTTNVVITSAGSLIVRYFKEEMAGMYTCTLHYSTAVKQYEKKVTLKYLIYAYMEPNFYYEFSVRYRSAPCQSPNNMLFENKLIEMMQKLISDFTCEVILLKAECHHIKMQRAGLQNELFFLFSVFPLDTTAEVICSNNCASKERLNKAKHILEEFFQKQADKLDEIKGGKPEIYYVRGTLHMVGVNRCFPGYGMDVKMHPECTNCCVICSPGTYNPDDGVHCLTCNSSIIYGAKKCRTF